MPFFARKRVLFLFCIVFCRYARRRNFSVLFAFTAAIFVCKTTRKERRERLPVLSLEAARGRINRGIVAVPVSGMFFATSVCFALCFSTDNKRLFFGFVLLIFPLLRHFFYAVFYRLLFFANEFTNGVGIYGEKQSRATTEREPQTKTFFHFFLRVALYRLFCRKAS